MCSRPVLLLGKYNSRFCPLWHRLRPVLLLEPDRFGGRYRGCVGIPNVVGSLVSRDVGSVGSLVFCSRMISGGTSYSVADETFIV